MLDKQMTLRAVFLLFLAMAFTTALVKENDTETITNTNKPLSFGQIEDIDVNVSRSGKRSLQLQVMWKDNLPNDTSYNVIVSALDPTKCTDMPCSIYGVKKTQMQKEKLTLKSPMSIVDNSECGYKPGCDYKLVVETSNAMVAKIANSKNISIPDCVMDFCSCHHAATLPKVQMVAEIPKNDTINVNWSVKWNDSNQTQQLTKPQVDNMLATLKLNKIYLQIGEQTNPSLSWGGKRISIAEKFLFLNDKSVAVSNGALQGKAKIETSQEMTSNAILSLYAYIEDTRHCQGPANLIKIKVPSFSEPQAALIENEKKLDVRFSLVVTTSVIAFIVILASVFFIWHRKKQKQIEAEKKKNEQYLSPFAVVDMEDNINYVDKDVQEAQAKGLADIFEMPHYAIQLEVEIGEGAFGRVYKGIAQNLRRMRGATVVAVKQLKRNPTADEISEFLSEIEMLKGVGTHNNIVCFLGCCTIRPPYLMIMEYVGRGDLLTYLRTVRQYASKVQPGDANYSSCKLTKTPNPAPVKYIELKISTQSEQSIDSDAEMERQPKPSFAETTYTIIDEEPVFEYLLDHKELHNFALQITNGMRFLEEQEITHRDLAARNVLIDERKTLKISDFGLSRHGIYVNTKTRKLPLRWLSIEAMRDNIYSNKSDVWAFGVVLWEIGTLGASPYPTISNHELIPFLLAGKRLEKPDICTTQVYDIMLKCWHADPDERPTFEELYKILSPKSAYIDINSLSDDYVFPPIKGNDDTTT